jgi:hypothetical protein
MMIAYEFSYLEIDPSRVCYPWQQSRDQRDQIFLMTLLLPEEKMEMAKAAKYV